MASDNKKPSLKEDLTCSICYELFSDPVMLACMHHFCRACISTYWRGIRGTVSCPQCRHEFPDRQLQTNFLVSGMVEKVRASSGEGYQKNLQNQLKDSLESHCAKREEYLNMIRQDKEQVDTIKRVGAELQARVQAEFQALRELLQQEEQEVLGELRREQEELLERAERRLEQLRAAVREAEESVRVLQQAADAVETSVLLELPEVNFRPSLQVEKGAEFDVSAFAGRYSGPLQYITWRRMYRLLRPAPAALTFDPETAHPSLCLSRDKTSVVECQEMLPYKRNPKRFTQCVNVLAAQGFPSGRHYWEVGVAGNAKWDLGVALEAVDRRARAKLSPENGYWTLRLRDGGRYWAGTQPWTPLRVDPPPRTVGVFLDCEERLVSFYNAESMRLIYSFRHGPRGRAYPFFSTCVSERGQKPQPIKLLHFPQDPL
ncbi:tripartite motif containing 105 [Anguilla rostrata]|uniref:tripartite motif containing 105 n=1 Tax=Anguilla rostrata TaxID=7938 RepID=UPI0030D35AF7